VPAWRWVVVVAAAGAQGACGPSFLNIGDEVADGSSAGDASPADAFVPPDSSGPTDASGPTDVFRPPDTSVVADSGSGPGDGGVHDANADAPDRAGCPPAAPPAGSPCPEVGEQCEYGTSATPVCNQLAQCTTTGWIYGSACTGAACATSCPAGTCPAQYPSAPTPSTAPICTDKGLVCAYPAGTCTCAAAGAAVSTDAGIHWTCFPAQPGCPTPRPDIGSACPATTTPNTCDYGACSGGVAVECEAGTWQVAMTACPQ
jgi:hypothetical protein